LCLVEGKKRQEKKNGAGEAEEGMRHTLRTGNGRRRDAASWESSRKGHTNSNTET
jgi:hypothetical protein